ncbi:hypothetical protein FHS27_006485 [Rhodopirellula rubra]|uniref:Uncharacterized protein n=1 Tax=Aporhodopirellula rubra TaxID=980271 RepID=A0A7W5H8F8_9BACT|nr:hypothetical protein [Aporhodopirellula rubra]MBB3210637.1 hypothetical protein [Aporhodopirellula rubra]
MMQTSGPGYVVKYTADFDAVPSTDAVTASVANWMPDDADPALVEMAREFIADAFTQVLNPRGLSATVVIRDLVIHDVDFSEYAFKRFTIAGLEALLAESSA